MKSPEKLAQFKSCSPLVVPQFRPFEELWINATPGANALKTLHKTPVEEGRDVRSVYCEKLADASVPLSMHGKQILRRKILRLPEMKKAVLASTSFESVLKTINSESISPLKYYGYNLIDLARISFDLNVLPEIAQDEAEVAFGCTFLELRMIAHRFINGYFELNVARRIINELRPWAVILGAIDICTNAHYSHFSNTTKKRAIHILVTEVLPGIDDVAGSIKVENNGL